MFKLFGTNLHNLIKLVATTVPASERTLKFANIGLAIVWVDRSSGNVGAVPRSGEMWPPKYTPL